MTLKTRTWQDVLEDPRLQDLPYKIELDEEGNLLMSPATNRHGLLQVEIAVPLRDMMRPGKCISECSILTSKGVRVADVAWVSRERRAEQKTDLFTTAPEICVEITNPSNTALEIADKTRLYLEAGASEVWTCTLEGALQFFDSQGELEDSKLVMDFPRRLEMD